MVNSLPRIHEALDPIPRIHIYMTCIYYTYNEDDYSQSVLYYCPEPDFLIHIGGELDLPGGEDPAQSTSSLGH